MMNYGISAQHVLHGSDDNKSSSCSGVIFVISINVIKRVGCPPIGIYSASGGGLPKNNFIIGCDNITVGCAAEGNGKGLLSPVGWNCPQVSGHHKTIYSSSSTIDDHQLLSYLSA